jgi:chorismate dehydratase
MLYMNKLRISAVSYLNTKPFIRGMESSGFVNQVDLSLDIPSVCAAKLLDGRVDVGLVPVAIIPELREHHIITDYCIGADGPVKSVLLYSNVPLTEIQSVLLDNQSRTSVALVKILAKHLWNIAPEWTLATDGYENSIAGTRAGVVIGDRTFRLKDRFAYSYDLAECWKELTGLPFVFACWVSNKPIDVGLEADFNKALKMGVSQAADVAKQYETDFPAGSHLEEYLCHNLSYTLDTRKRQGLTQFLGLLSTTK